MLSFSTKALANMNFPKKFHKQLKMQRTCPLLSLTENFTIDAAVVPEVAKQKLKIPPLQEIQRIYLPGFTIRKYWLVKSLKDSGNFEAIGPIQDLTNLYQTFQEVAMRKMFLQTRNNCQQHKVCNLTPVIIVKNWI